MLRKVHTMKDGGVMRCFVFSMENEKDFDNSEEGDFPHILYN